MEIKTVNLTTRSGSGFEVQVEPPAECQSFFAFSFHKAGSTLLNSALAAVCRELSIPFFAPEQLEFDHGQLLGSLDESVLQLFVPQGYCYAGFRVFPAYLDQFDLTSFRKILLIRDPRDMVVSHYYSAKISHQIPPGQLGERLKEVRSDLETKSIDDYAIESAPGIRERFRKYEASIFDDQLKLFRYEDIIFSKRKWLRDIFEFVGVDADVQLLDRIADRQDILPEKEDASRHIRRVTPGDHREKLAPKTIGELNRIFADQLELFGYAVDRSLSKTPVTLS